MPVRSNELVSVIIPVYNMQDYLERCVKSALGQTHRELQIILINDGSTDNSGEICEAFGGGNPQIEVIHRENGGLSAARNTGLDHASGKWITFLDADDYISRFFIEESLAACLSYDADIAACRYVPDREGNLGEESFAKASTFDLITGREAAIRHFGKDAIWLNMAWGKLSRASLWRDLRFPVGKINEDVFVSHKLFFSAGKVVISDAYLYAYYLSPGSIMRKPFTLQRLDVLDAWREGVVFYEKAGDRELYDIARRVYCNRLFDAYGVCRRLLPAESGTHKQLRRQAITAYNEARRVNSYIDLSLSKALLNRGKQFLGRYFPAVYAAIFTRSRTYI